MSRNHPIQNSEQEILNKAYESSKKAIAVAGVETDGTNELYQVSELVAEKNTIIKNGAVTTIYKAIAPIATALSTAGWQINKTVIDTSVTDVTNLVVTWCDGNAEFDNVATDLTSLSYS